MYERVGLELVQSLDEELLFYGHTYIYLSLASVPTHSLHKYKHGFRPKIYSSAHCVTHLRIVDLMEWKQ